MRKESKNGFIQKSLLMVIIISIIIAAIGIGAFLYQKNRVNKLSNNPVVIGITTTTNETEKIDNVNEIKTETTTIPTIPTKPVVTATTLKKDAETLFFVDVHAHAASADNNLLRVINYLDVYAITKMILMQPPADFSKYIAPEEMSIPLAKEMYPNKFMVMYQGEAIKLLQEVARRGSYTQEEENNFKKFVEGAAKSGLYAGFGEIALRHFPQSGLQGIRKEARDITVSGDHPWLLYLADIAANYNMVLDIHMEPNEITLVGFEKLISHNLKTKIMFDHAGWYNTGLGTANLFESLFLKHSNLYASIKIRKSMDEEQLKVAIMGPDGEINKDWLNVFEKYSSRFVIGTDIKLGLKSEDENNEEVFMMTKKFIEKLPENLRKKIAFENANLIFGIK